LVATGARASHDAARVYEHVETTEEARKPDLLPFAKQLKKSSKKPARMKSVRAA
jgi:hypothetical protein